MSTAIAPNNRRALSLAFVLYLVWVFATWLLEGRIHTLLRPEAMGARLSYALVANVLIGIGGSALVIRFVSRAGTLSPEQAGFRGLGHAAMAVVIGVVLGFAFYALQGAPSWNPVVLLNAYAQVLVGSIAEVMVCWAVVGSVSQALLQDRGRWVSLILAAIIASILFGFYHLAHSPPFNTVPVVVFLSAIGLVTSLFYFVSRDVYGTIAFHNFLGILGVMRALEASGNLSSFERPIVPLLVMAVIAVALLIAAHVFWINPRAAPTSRRVR
jgi:membrane protease YdiL (CAAX protease family)